MGGDRAAEFDIVQFGQFAVLALRLPNAGGNPSQTFPNFDGAPTTSSVAVTISTGLLTARGRWPVATGLSASGKPMRTV